MGKPKSTKTDESTNSRRKVNRVTLIVLGAIAVLFLAIVVPMTNASNARDTEQCVSILHDAAVDNAQTICDNPTDREQVLKDWHE